MIGRREASTRDQRPLLYSRTRGIEKIPAAIVFFECEILIGVLLSASSRGVQHGYEVFLFSLDKSSSGYKIFNGRDKFTFRNFAFLMHVR